MQRLFSRSDSKLRKSPHRWTRFFEKFQEASLGPLKGVLYVEGDELVSCDFQGNSHSAVIDTKACVQLNSKVLHFDYGPIHNNTLMLLVLQFFKILAWYDNEWAYSTRLLDMLGFMAKADQQQ